MSEHPFRSPRDCVDALLTRMLANLDPPGSKYEKHNMRRMRRYAPIPDARQLETLLDVAHAASLQPEEGRYPAFGLAFVGPRGVLDGNYDVAKFSSVRPFTPEQIAKLAPATNVSRTCIGVHPRAGRLAIWGLFT